MPARPNQMIHDHAILATKCTRPPRLESTLDLLPQKVLGLFHPLETLLFNLFEVLANSVLPGTSVLGDYILGEGKLAGTILVDTAVPREQIDGPGRDIGQHIRRRNLDHTLLQLGRRHGNREIRI